MSIVLFSVVLNMQSNPFTAKTPWIIIGQFLALAIVSILIGVFFGVVITLAFKHMRFLTANATMETFLMAAMGLLTYFTTIGIYILGVEMSGIISLLVYAIICGHYNWYNLSPQGKSTTGVSYEFLGKGCEAAVYSYVGLALYTAIPGYWSFELIGWMTAIIVVGRFIGVLFTFYAFRICFRKESIRLN